MVWRSVHIKNPFFITHQLKGNTMDQTSPIYVWNNPRKHFDAVIRANGHFCILYLNHAVGEFRFDGLMLTEYVATTGNDQKIINDASHFARNVGKFIMDGADDNVAIRMARGFQQCTLCKCTATALTFSFPVCEYHTTHGENDPLCRTCAPGPYTASSSTGKKVFAAMQGGVE